MRLGDGAVEVLGGAPDLAGADQLDHLQLSQDPHVVGDVADDRFLFGGEFARAGDTLAENR
jgi:hypothetical protein